MTLNEFYESIRNLPTSWVLTGHNETCIRSAENHYSPLELLCYNKGGTITWKGGRVFRPSLLHMFFEHGRILGLSDPDTHAIFRATDNDIWRYICFTSNRTIQWWAFQNDNEYGNGNGSDGGEFDPQADKDWVEILGERDECPVPGFKYEDGFPTHFLWMPYEEFKKTVKDHFNECKVAAQKAKENAAQKRRDDAQKKSELRESIKSKLTKEEWNLVKKVFK